MEKNFLQIYNWYVPMVQMEKKIRADLPLVRTDGTNEKSFLTDLQLVRTTGTNEKIFLKKSVPAVQNGKFFSIFAQK